MLCRVGHSLATSGKQHALRSSIYVTFPHALDRSAGRRAFSQSVARRSYDDTIRNLLIKKDTKVLCQGITGKTVRLLDS